ncbi:MAG: transposase [Longimicrobiales bacterium]
MPFHITARIQCRERLLSGLEAKVVTMILASQARSDAGLIAYAIMPNHLHIVVQQGGRPLSDYMQPLLRRIALHVRRSCGWEGHVFERRYRESACLTADHLRHAITYVHLNGVRASLADTVEKYPWCSHEPFCHNESANVRSRLAMEDALRVFADQTDDTLPRCTANYRAFVRWRTLLDARAASLDEDPGWHPPAPPCVSGGDEHWCRMYLPFIDREVERRSTRTPRMDLRDLAVIIMREFDPAMQLDDLRRSGSMRSLRDVRRNVILRASAAGYSGRAISNFLSVSPATVSRARAGM